MESCTAHTHTHIPVCTCNLLGELGMFLQVVDAKLLLQAHFRMQEGAHPSFEGWSYSSEAVSVAGMGKDPGLPTGPGGSQAAVNRQWRTNKPCHSSFCDYGMGRTHGPVIPGCCTLRLGAAASWGSCTQSWAGHGLGPSTVRSWPGLGLSSALQTMLRPVLLRQDQQLLSSAHSGLWQESS